MTRPCQKTKERAILDRYLSVHRRGGDVFDGHEPPDFLLKIDGLVIGIEITQYHISQPTEAGHTRRQVEAAWNHLRNLEAETRTSPDEFNIVLNFSELLVPALRNECIEFINAVWSKLAASHITPEYRLLEIDQESPSILRRFLRNIGAERVNSWMEWDWNHHIARVGTTDGGLLAVIEHKLSVGCHAPGIDKNHLIVGGFSSNLSEFAAIISVQQLNGYARLNAALEAAAFDEVTIIDAKNFVWTRKDGWREVK